MNEAILANGLQYRLKTTGKIFTLTKDYNGYWFLYCNDDKAIIKTRSYPENIMKSTLYTSYEMI